METDKSKIEAHSAKKTAKEENGLRILRARVEIKKQVHSLNFPNITSWEVCYTK